VAAGGGHPPPLLVRADGASSWLEAPGRPVGYPLAGSEGALETVLAVGDTVLFYTDGLVEVTGDLVVGLDRLEQILRAEYRRPLAELTALVVDRLLDDAERRDHTLALGLRRVDRG
jgi:phosphoserine phosphatase RsbU/P